MQKRRADITIIRVISMLMIVLCHTVKYYSFIPGNNIVNQFLNVGVEIFFAMSGFLYAKKTVTSYKQWMIGRIRKIYIPMLFVAVVDCIVLFVMFKTSYSLLIYAAYFLNLQGLLFINRKWFSQFFSAIPNLAPLWFITVIMLCYSMVPLFQKIRDRIKPDKKIKTYLGILLPLYLIALVVELTTGTNFFYILVFWTGYIIADIDYDKLAFSTRNSVIWSVLAISMLALRVVLKVKFGGADWYASAVSVEHTALGLSIMLLIMEMGKKFPAIYERIGHFKAVAFLDDMSFYIYLVHGIFCMGVTNIYSYFRLIPATILFVLATLIYAGIVRYFTQNIDIKLLSRIR